MRRGLAGLVVALCTVFAARAADGQQVRGIVHDSASAAVLPGAVVAIVDSAGKTAGRTIADGAGRFSVARPSNAASLHVVRIGYQPRDIPIPASPKEITLEFAMRRLPAMLDAVRVSDRELCPGSTDRSDAFQLWEQARAGLLAAVVARDANPAMATTLVYERESFPTDPLVRRQVVHTKSGPTTRPFVASEVAAMFAKRGYMREDARGRMFFAPDADVLLDETFAATHCFHLKAGDDTHRDQIGIAFAPIPGRDTVVEVAGVIWMDRTTPALRSFDFQFTQIEPAAERAGIGGHLEFLSMPNGVSFVERWFIRLATLEPIPFSGRAGTTRPIVRRQDNIDVRVTAMHESGGQVLSATWGDKTSWRDSSAGLAGEVTQQSTNAPIPFALVVVEGTSDTVTADAQGKFSIVPLVPGRYSIVAIDTTLQAFVAPRTDAHRVDVVRGAVSSYQVRLDPLTRVIERACSGQKVREKTTALIGQLVLPDGRPGRDAEIRATWLADFNGKGIAYVSNGREVTKTDARGRFVVCGVAVERPVKLRATLGGDYADTTVKVYDSLLKSIEWRPALAVAAAGAVASFEGVVVRDSTRAPIAGAEVSIPALRQTATTTVDGVFQFGSVPPGSYRFEIRHVGDAAATDSITLAPGARLKRTYALGRVIALDTVRAVAAAAKVISPAMRGYEERRRGAIGRFIDDTLLRKSENSAFADVLRIHFPGLKLQRGANGEYAMSARDPRGGKLALIGGTTNRGDMRDGCYATIYLNGVLLFDQNTTPSGVGPPSLNDFPVSSLGAVEYYAGGGTTPSGFVSSECGLILLWTRER